VLESSAAHAQNDTDNDAQPAGRTLSETTPPLFVSPRRGPHSAGAGISVHDSGCFTLCSRDSPIIGSSTARGCRSPTRD
jgi:hypothetical protein